MAGREQVVVDRVEAILGNLGCYNVNVHGTAMGSRAGKPDIIGCVGGRFCGIECKAEGEQPTYVQWLNLVQIARSGGRAVVAYPDVTPGDLEQGCRSRVEIPASEDHEAAMELFKGARLRSRTSELSGEAV